MFLEKYNAAMPKNFLVRHRTKFVFLCFWWEIQMGDII